ncbi:glycosyltransferase family 2 protein [Shimia sp. SDUM112013]|uniref:glycosyltransferase family 2 protein n=1 Tax=Shimia sp. SDUM112013 TaxID=3136160 RepID=UPI0032ECEA39
MKIAALTMVYRDYWALGQWYRHYAKHLGPERLYVVAHGPDPNIAQICPGSSVITIPRDDLEGFDRKRGDMLNLFQAALLKTHDWVIRTDADELICWHPRRYNSLEDVFVQNADAPVLTALGMDIADLSETGGGVPFRDVRDAAFSGHYSKAFAARIPADLHLHGVRVPPSELQSFPFLMPRGVYLMHLKYANRAVLSDTNAARRAVATGEGKGLPGKAWRNPDKATEDFFLAFQDKELVPWKYAERVAFDFFSKRPSRVERYSLVKTRLRRWPIRTVLPDWFADL